MMSIVNWNRGPWAWANPNLSRGAAVPQAQPSAYASLMGDPVSDVEGSSGLGGRGRSAMGEYGPMTGAELSGMWGGVAKSKLGSYGINSLVAGTPAPLGVSSLYGIAPYAGVTLASLLSSILGGVRGYEDPSITSEVDIQGLRDVYGDYAAKQAEAVNRSARGYANELAGVNQPGYSNDGSMGPGPGISGDPGPGMSDGVSDAGGESFARGGVKTFKRPSKPLVGEAGKEKGIFIPEQMKRKGMQGNERQVRRGLYSSLMDLTGKRGR